MFTLDLILHTVPAALAIGGIYSAGELTRSRWRRGSADFPGVTNDTLGTVEGFVDLFAKSRMASAILAALAGRREAIGFDALVKRTRSQDAALDLTGATALSAFRAVLGVLLSARLVQMCAGGFWITALGREVHRRLRGGGGSEHTSGVRAERANPHRTNAARLVAVGRSSANKHPSLASSGSFRR